jgi:hypothetical protein
LGKSLTTAAVSPFEESTPSGTKSSAKTGEVRLAKIAVMAIVAISFFIRTPGIRCYRF